MVQFFISGGFAMWFVLAFGLAALIGAAFFAWRPSELRLGTLRAVSWATAFAAFAGFIAGVAVTLSTCARLPAEELAHWHLFAIQGFAESCSNLILGAALLAATWLVIAIGLRRLSARDAS